MRQIGLHVVARTLAFRAVDHADEAFEQVAGKAVAQVPGPSEIGKEARDAGCMAQRLPTAGQGRANGHHLHLVAPVGGSGDGAGGGAEADQRRLVPEAFTAELAQVQLVHAASHGCRPGIADVRVVGPDHGPCPRAARFEDLLQRFEHVPVTQVPRRGAALIHGAIVAFRRADQAGVLRRVKIALGVAVHSALQDLAALGDHGLLAAAIALAQHRAAVMGGLLGPGRQASIAAAGDAGGFGIVAVEIAEHRLDGAGQTVKVQPEDPCALVRRAVRVLAL